LFFLKNSQNFYIRYREILLIDDWLVLFEDSPMKTKNTSKSLIQMQADSTGQHLDLFLIGYVGDWGNSVEDFLWRIRQMNNLKTIDVYINSLGGCFDDGLPIYNILKMHPAYVTTKVIGYACSMASVIMLAGDKVQASQNSIIMIHRAQGLTWGDADDMTKMAEILIVHENSVIPRYMERMEKTAAEILGLLRAETWYNAKPALEAGLIDEIIEEADISTGQVMPLTGDNESDDLITENSAKYALEHYRNIPTELKSRLEQVTASKQEKTLFSKFLNFVSKESPQLLANKSTVNSPQDDIDMTKEEVQLLVNASVEEKTAALKAEFEQTINSATEGLKTDLAAEKDKNVKLSEQVAALETTLAEFEKPLPTTKVPVAGSADTDGDKW
jgi:ATP-dependent protease ClpP protease subunit